MVFLDFKKVYRGIENQAQDTVNKGPGHREHDLSRIAAVRRRQNPAYIVSDMVIYRKVIDFL